MRNIYCFDYSVKMPLLKLPARTVVVKLEAAVVMISPSQSLQSLEKELAALGPVTDIVAPNIFHNLGIAGAKTQYPTATLWGVLGVEKKLKGTKIDKLLPTDEWPYHEELPAFQIDGQPKINETVFFHVESKTLIVQDLCFHHTDGKGIGYNLVFRMFGTFRRFAVSKFFAKMSKDKNATRTSLAAILDLDFDNLIMAHGRIIQGGAKPLLIEALKERGLC